MAGEPSRLRDQRGFALLATLLVFVLLLTLGSSSLVYSVLDMKSTTHYDTGNQAFAAAESGILHALSTMNTPGVVNFQNDIVQRWSQLYGSALKTIPSAPGVGYEVAVSADAANPVDRGRITATGLAPLQARRVLAVTLRRGNFNGTAGAIYLAADAIRSSRFSGNAFEVDGDDHGLSGGLVAGGVVKPGIATRNDTVTSGVVSSLQDNQKDNVRGAGFSLNPLTPSVLTTGGPSVDDLDQIVANLLSLPGVVTTDRSNYNGHDTFGTIDAPQITHMTHSNVRLNGNASGAGILIADGSVTINGTLDFIGWIIVRGSTVINSTGRESDETIALGNATILGSLWTGHLDIKVGGSAIIDYCDACLRLADTTGNADGNIPRPMTVVSWEETL